MNVSGRLNVSGKYYSLSKRSSLGDGTHVFKAKRISLKTVKDVKAIDGVNACLRITAKWKKETKVLGTLPKKKKGISLDEVRRNYTNSLTTS